MNNKNIIVKAGTFCLAAVLGMAIFSAPVQVNASQLQGAGVIKLNNDILKIPKVTESVLNAQVAKAEFKNTASISAESFESELATDQTAFCATRSGTWNILCNYGGGKLVVKDQNSNTVVNSYVSKNSSVSMNLIQGKTYTVSVSQVNPNIGLLIIEPKDVIDLSGYNYVSDKAEFKDMSNYDSYTAPESGKFVLTMDKLTSSSNTIKVVVKDSNGTVLASDNAMRAGKAIGATFTKGQKYSITVTGITTSEFGISLLPSKTLDITNYTRIDDAQTYNSCINTYTYKAPIDGAYYFALESKAAPLSFSIKDKNNKTIQSLDFVTSKLGAKVDLKGGETYTVSVGCAIASGNNRSAYSLYVTPQKPTLDVTEHDKVEDSFTFKYQKNNYTLNVPEKGDYTFNFDLADSQATFVNFYIYDAAGNTVLSKEYRKKDSPKITKTLEKGTYTISVRGEEYFTYAMTIQNPNRITEANEQILDFVRRLYVYVLGREAEQDGLRYWSAELFNFRITGAEVAQGFIFSSEFQNRGTSDEEFLKILYRTFFNREPDEAGMNYWLDQLSSHRLDRAAVANGFIFSQEWADTCASYGIRSGGNLRSSESIKPTDKTYAFVERMYTTALGRSFDQDGREYWAQGLASYNMTGESVGVAFFLSDEIVSYNLSNEEFVNRLYLTFMDREPEAEGQAYWVDLLSSGTPRANVVYGFTRSAEFIEKCDEARIIPFA